MNQKYSIEWLKSLIDEGETPKYIYFWGHTSKSEVGKQCFSQWYEKEFTVDKVTYKTAEHWMMAHKARLFKNEDIFEKIINSNSPGEVKSLGRKVKGFDEKIWNENRYKIVVEGNYHKFTQHPKLKEFLVNTNNRIIVEASPVDKIWGIGMAQDHKNIEDVFSWKGENLLGFALMEVRDMIK